MGLLLVVLVTGADALDAVAAEDVRALLRFDRWSRLRIIWADSAYARANLFAAMTFWGAGLLGIVRRPEGVKGWVHLAKRWVVERTFGWLVRCRRHSRDYERKTESSEAMIYVSMISLMLHRLAPESVRYRFHYRATG